MQQAVGPEATWRHSFSGSDDRGLLQPDTIGEKLISVLSSTFAVSLVGQFIAAIVLLMASLTLDASTTHNWAYSVVVAAVAMLFALAGLCLLAASAADKLVFTAPVLGDMNAGALVAVLMMAWWGVGVYVLTFLGPFLSTTNGYFSTWLGFACSVRAISATLPRLISLPASSASSLMGLGACALLVGLELGSGPYFVSRQLIFGMGVCTFTFAIALITLLLELSGAPLEPPVARALHITTVLLWGAAALWLTFTKPFSVTSNGYFGLWIGFVCASRLVLDVQKRMAAAVTNERLYSLWCAPWIEVAGGRFLGCARLPMSPLATLRPPHCPSGLNTREGRPASHSG